MRLKFVLNKCYGGYGLSAAAVKRLAELNALPECDEDGKPLVQWQGESEWDFKVRRAHELPRHDANLVRVVEELGEAANGMSAKLKVINVDLYSEIECYVGKETLIVGRESY